MPVDERFWNKVDRSGGPDACWPWMGVRCRKYGRFYPPRNGGKRPYVLAHRYVMNAPQGSFVCHHCDNPQCVNPAHLYIGNCTTNARDRVERGRQTKGEAVNTSRLTEPDVLELRRAFRAGESETYEQAASRFGVDADSVSKAVRGKTWKHLNDIEAPLPRRRPGTKKRPRAKPTNERKRERRQAVTCREPRRLR